MATVEVESANLVPETAIAKAEEEAVVVEDKAPAVEPVTENEETESTPTAAATATDADVVPKEDHPTEAEVDDKEAKEAKEVIEEPKDEAKTEEKPEVVAKKDEEVVEVTQEVIKSSPSEPDVEETPTPTPAPAPASALEEEIAAHHDVEQVPVQKTTQEAEE